MGTRIIHFLVKHILYPFFAFYDWVAGIVTKYRKQFCIFLFVAVLLTVVLAIVLIKRTIARLRDDGSGSGKSTGIWIGILLLVALLAASTSALAEAKLSEATMIYEDYDGNHADWTVNDDGELKELVDMLTRAKKHRAQLENCTMNCTLLCKVDGETLIDFAVATDGCHYVTDMDRDATYRLEDEDWDRLWEIFDQIQEAMGYDASLVLDW